MSDLDSIKKMLLDADEETNRSTSKAEHAARKIVNIERQAYYGGQPSNKRLGLIRTVISEFSQEVMKDEA